MTSPNAGLVERVARALAIADGKDPDAPAWVEGYGNRERTFGICWRDQYADKATAVIAALPPQTDNPTRQALSELLNALHPLSVRGRPISTLDSRLAEAMAAGLSALQYAPPKTDNALVEALRDARKAIASLDDDAFGFVDVPPEADGETGYQYPIRDELLAKIDAALAAQPQSQGQR